MTLRNFPRLLAAGVAACICAPLFAEPVQVQHSSGEGAGYTFRRGNTCTVVTAAHVVLRNNDLPANDLLVLDRSGARVTGRVAYSNPAYDLALITLPEDSEVACSSTWPDTIVLRVRPRDDRVEVLRFDRIDQLVGDRFRSGAGAQNLTLAGVFMNNRENPTWTTYVRSWLVEHAGWSIVPAGDPTAFCTVKVNVTSWNRTNQANADYTRARDNAATICKRNGFLAEQLCKAANREVAETPRTLTTHKITLELSMTLPSGTASSKLGTGTYEHGTGVSYRSPEVELPALQRAVSGLASEMFDAGACG